MKYKSPWIVMLSIGMFLGPARAATTAPAVTAGLENLSVTHHAIQVPGRPLEYTATAGYLPLTDPSGKLQARMFFVAYEKKGGGDKALRPITFAFNGGPGAAASWLHFGALGPRRLPFPDDGKAIPQHPHLIDNEFTWLTFTDLVFIDPVGTGYSRAAPGVDPKSFYGVEGDVRSVGGFIREYTTRFERWLSPKFLAGESYGTTRAAGLAGHLQNRLGINVTGLILISTVLDFQTIAFDPGNDLPFVLSLPSYTAAAWYHHKLPPARQKDLLHTLADAQDWAVNRYLPALVKGDVLPEADRRDLLDRLASFTGLDREYLEAQNLRVGNFQFTKHLLRDEHRLIGLMDARVVGFDPNPTEERGRFDPSFFLTINPLAAVANDYLRRELKVDLPLPYEYLSRKVNADWDYKNNGMGYLNVTDTLKEAMTQNPHLRVMIAGGYFDLTTPYFTSIYLINHLNLAPDLRKNIYFLGYPSGHQIYTRESQLKKLTEDAAGFFKKTD